MAEPDTALQKSGAGRIAGPKKRPHPLTLDAAAVAPVVVKNREVIKEAAKTVIGLIKK